jgi:hypothetical protein
LRDLEFLVKNIFLQAGKSIAISHRLDITYIWIGTKRGQFYSNEVCFNFCATLVYCDSPIIPISIEFLLSVYTWLLSSDTSR